ncbi:unnamed protein product, partial [marine sediment metagenome]
MSMGIGVATKLDDVVGGTNGIYQSYQKKSFYAVGRFWFFYCEHLHAWYRTSIDGVIWSDAIQVTTWAWVGGGRRFSVFFDGEYMHYVSTSEGDWLRYRRGLVNRDGTIAWSQPEQTVITIAGQNFMYPTIAVDTDGYAFIGYNRNIAMAHTPWLIKNANNDGTWATDWNVQLNAGAHGSWTATVVQLIALRMYVVYAKGEFRP